MYSYYWGQKQTYYGPHDTTKQVHITDRPTNGPTDGRTDPHIDAWTHLKNRNSNGLTDRKPWWSTSLPHSDWLSKITQPNHSGKNGSTSSVNLKRKRVKTRYITLNISIHCSPLTWLESNFGSEFLICFLKIFLIIFVQSKYYYTQKSILN